MNQERFDELTRHLSQTRSRRAVLKGLIAGVAGGLIGASTSGVALADSPTASINAKFDWSSLIAWIYCSLKHLREPNFIFCANQCLDLSVDHDHCGACGAKCADCEQCVQGQCQSTCDDNNLCTTDICDRTTGKCRFEPINCDDGNACTADSCDPVVGCVHTPIVCDDDDPCTTDTCDPAVGCVYTKIDCGGLECQNGSCV